ncbi:MAG: hypothetical protein ABI134_09490 [Byssovorax sp.]
MLLLASLTDPKGSSMRLFSCAVAVPLLAMLVIGCNTVSPDECWPNTSGGIGGSGTIPIGAGVGATSGDFLEPPRGPLDDSDAANPCITPPTPCHEKCLADYEVEATKCGQIGDGAQRKTCQEGAYASYKSCRENCVQISKTCTDMYDACMDKGLPCTRHIDRGNSICAICRRSCQASKPYKSSECYKCGFE